MGGRNVDSFAYGEPKADEWEEDVEIEEVDRRGSTIKGMCVDKACMISLSSGVGATWYNTQVLVYDVIIERREITSW